MKKKTLKAFLVLAFLFLLFLFPAASLNGAKAGLLLWFNTVLPTLLPFMIVSNLIIALDIVSCLSTILYPVLHRLLGISKNGCYPVLIGMLSGYPVGAKACADLTMDHRITKKEGQFLLSFCNNASPMFILSFVAIQNLALKDHGYYVLGIILLSSLLSALLIRLSGKRNALCQEPDYAAAQTRPAAKKESGIFAILDSSILSAFQILVKVGGYIILFSILAQIVASFYFLPSMLRFLVIGLLEITTGISYIGASSLPIAGKIVLIMALTAFGGFSSLAQTKSVISDSGLSVKQYFYSKVLNAVICALLAALLIQIL